MSKILALLLVALALLGPATTATARPAASTLALVGEPVFGAEVTFDYTTTAELPVVYAECSQAGVVVYQETHARWFLLGTDPFIFTLGPTRLWQAGDADCTAVLYDYDQRKPYPIRKVLASVDFTTTDPAP
jgi:hypothetical protein